MIIKKCLKCGAVVKVLDDCNCDKCGISCCNDKMTVLKINHDELIIEKHMPNYEIKEGKIIVTVNHVMEENHYIQWICLTNDYDERTVYLKPGDSAKAVFDYIKNAKIYVYCNKHNLWMKEVN